MKDEHFEITIVVNGQPVKVEVGLGVCTAKPLAGTEARGRL